jgi:hypothetical protein
MAQLAPTKAKAAAKNSFRNMKREKIGGEEVEVN